MKSSNWPYIIISDVLSIYVYITDIIVVDFFYKLSNDSNFTQCPFKINKSTDQLNIIIH